MKRLHQLYKRGFQPSVAEILSESSNTNSEIHQDQDSVGNKWDDNWKTIARELNNHPMGFLRQPVTRRAVHPNQQNLAFQYLSEMKKSNFACEKILPRIYDLPVGDPYLCEFFPMASPLTIQHAYYLHLMYEKLGFFIPESRLNQIFELGGGYGNFCRLVYSLGYSDHYRIADLPVMHSLQHHFLKYALPSHLHNGNVDFCALSDQGIWPSNGCSLFIATFSLSEMPLVLRKEVEEYLKKFDYLFLAYNKAFDGVENPDYFKELEQRLRTNFSVDHFKDQHRRAWYLLAKQVNS